MGVASASLMARSVSLTYSVGLTAWCWFHLTVYPYPRCRRYRPVGRWPWRTAAARRRVLELSLLLFFLLSRSMPSRQPTGCGTNCRSFAGVSRHRTDERSGRCSLGRTASDRGAPGAGGRRLCSGLGNRNRIDSCGVFRPQGERASAISALCKVVSVRAIGPLDTCIQCPLHPRQVVRRDYIGPDPLPR